MQSIVDREASDRRYRRVMWSGISPDGNERACGENINGMIWTFVVLSGKWSKAWLIDADVFWLNTRTR